MAVREGQSITVDSSGVTRQGASNEKGHFNFRETTSKNGNYRIESDLKTQELVSTDKETAVKGNDISDIGGNSSKIVTGVSEIICGTEYKIIGTANMYNTSAQELANKAQLRLVATRSMPDKVPDPSLLTTILSLLKPKPHLISSIVQPKAEEMQEIADSANIVQPGGGLGRSIAEELAIYYFKMELMMSFCTVETAKEVVKIQANWMKDSAKQSLKEKQKMYKKLSGPSKEAFKENFGNILFDEEGEVTLETATNALDAVTNPVKLTKLFFPVTPPQDDDKKIPAYDKDKALDEITKSLPEVIEAERNIC